MSRLTRLCFLASLLLGLSVASVSAQDAPSAPSAERGMDSPEDRATTFRAVSGAEQEQVPGGTLMVASYALIWLFLMLYLHRIGRLSAAVRADVERLSAAVESRGERGSPR